jgi:hypothetical protein
VKNLALLQTFVYLTMFMGPSLWILGLVNFVMAHLREGCLMFILAGLATTTMFVLTWVLGRATGDL